MPDPKHTAYERLKELHSEAECATYAWTDSGKSTEWRQKVQSALRRLFGDDCTQLQDFNALRYGPIIFSAGTPESVFRDSFMSGMQSAMAIIRSAIQEYEDYDIQPDAMHSAPQNSAANESTRKLFVVHGHDNEMKESVARFLERIDFEPIILHEQASSGDTIIEKFERHADVSYAVVLLSPDDIGAVKTKADSLQPRARQNVILELGYFVGRLGRSHVCPFVRGPLEVPSDIHGVIYTPFDGEDWKLHLVRELKHLGFDIDANKAF